MGTRLVVLAGFLASTMTFPTIRAEAAPAPRPGQTGTTLIGCVVKGDDGYLLTNLPIQSSTGSQAGASAVPGAVGTAGVDSTIFYLLENNNDLKRHVGHRVEIVGNLEDDPSNADVRLRRYYVWTQVNVKAGGHTLTALKPSAVPPPNADIDSNVRRVDVDHVFMLSVGCG